VGAFADGTVWTCPRCGERYESDDGAWLRVAADPEEQLREIWREVADLAPALPGPDLTIVRQAEPPPAPPAEDIDDQEETMTMAQERNGHSTRRLYTDDEKTELVAQFQAADDKRAFAAKSGVSQASLYKWAAGKDRKRGKAPGAAAPKAKARPARPPDDFARELDVLRQLVELPEDARDRIVAYLTARRG
jgi:transposase-like protein